MEIDKIEVVKVNAKTLKIHTKVTDRFQAQLVSSTGTEIYDQEDGYVPGFMPGDHYGDYLILDIDIDTGQITNWTTPTQNDVQSWISGGNED